jgi:hypothetical protein
MPVVNPPKPRVCCKAGDALDVVVPEVAKVGRYKFLSTYGALSFSYHPLCCLHNVLSRQAIPLVEICP